MIFRRLAPAPLWLCLMVAGVSFGAGPAARGGSSPSKLKEEDGETQPSPATKLEEDEAEAQAEEERRAKEKAALGGEPFAPGPDAPPPTQPYAPPQAPIGVQRSSSPPPPVRSTAADNRVSAFGAASLGQWKRGAALYLGFPLLGGRFLLGATDKLDLGVQVESFYFEMNDFRAIGRYQLSGDGRDGLAIVAEGGGAVFARRPFAEGKGSRWLTGRRDWNAAAGVVFSGSLQRGGLPLRFFAEVKYHLALDTQPVQTSPLGGAPPKTALGHNFPLRAGAEMPFSDKTSFLFSLGLDVHGREEDSRFMPTCTVGVVTGF